MHGGDIYSNKVLYDFSVNVNPLGCHWKIKRAVKKAAGMLAAYPDVENRKLRKMLAEKFGVKESQLVFGNGASELILAVVRALGVKKALLLSPCFSGYELAFAGTGCDVAYCQLDKTGEFCVTEKVLQEQIVKLITAVKPELFIITNPNNPNGKIVPPEILGKIADLCREKGTFLLVDECFIELTDFAFQNFAGKTEQNDRLIVLRSFTKTFAVPGVRLGYCVANERLAGQILRQLPEWNVSVVAAAAGEAAFGLGKYLRRGNAVVERERRYLTEKLKALGFEVFPSDTNFLLFFDLLGAAGTVAATGTAGAENVAAGKALEGGRNLKELLLKKKILIRDCSDYKGLEEGFFRIAVKRRRENRVLVKALAELVKYGK